MDFKRMIVRPYTLEVDRKYLLRVRHNNGRGKDYLVIQFVNYDACPAIVKVRSSDGKMWRVARDDIFTCEAILDN